MGKATFTVNGDNTLSVLVTTDCTETLNVYQPINDNDKISYDTGVVLDLQTIMTMATLNSAIAVFDFVLNTIRRMMITNPKWTKSSQQLGNEFYTEYVDAVKETLRLQDEALAPLGITTKDLTDNQLLFKVGIQTSTIMFERADAQKEDK